MRRLLSRAEVATVFLLLLVAAWRTLLAAQQSNPGQAIITTGVSEVLVDAVVTDRKNHLVTNLKAEDFVITEGGVPQEITSFHVYRGISQPSEPETETPAATTQVTPPILRPTSNLIILLVDYSTTQFENQQLIQQAAVKYVQQKMRSNDLMAVFVLGSGLHVLTNFTGDKTRLVAALKSRDLKGSAMAAERADLSSGIGIGESPGNAAPETALSTGIVTTGAAAAGAGAGMGSAGSARGDAMIAQRITAQFYVLRNALDNRQSREVLTAIRAIAMGVKHIQGRKSLILFSQGFVVGPTVEDELHSVVDLANRSNLVVYTIDSSGLTTKELQAGLVSQDELTSTAGFNQRDRVSPVGGETIFDRTREVGRDMRESALRYVAEATGGFLIHNTNDLGVGMDRVDDEMRSYYLLSYRPKDQNFDGQFREIRLEVRRPGLSVKARSGYYAVPSGYETLTPAEYQLLARARSKQASEEMTLFLKAAEFQAREGLYRVPVILEIPTREIQFDKKDEKYSSHLQIMGLVRDSSGRVIRQFVRPADYVVNEAEYKVLQQINLSFLYNLGLPAGIYSVETVVKDSISGKLSHGEQSLYLHGGQESLALSDVLLSNSFDNAPDAQPQFLTVGGIKIKPSAQCQFRNGDNLIYYFDVYRPQVDPKNKRADVSVELSLKRAGRPMNVRIPGFHVDQWDPAPIPHITLARSIELASLPPGDYALVVEVKDNVASRTVRTQASFSVVN